MSYWRSVPPAFVTDYFMFVNLLKPRQLVSEAKEDLTCYIDTRVCPTFYDCVKMLVSFCFIFNWEKIAVENESNYLFVAKHKHVNI